jgi:hypothetical protein
VVTWSPTIEAGVTKGGNPLALKTGDRLEFSVPEGWSSTNVYVYLENPGGETRLAISPLASEEGRREVDRIPLPGYWSGWLAIEITTEEVAHGFRLEIEQVAQGIFLRGIKSDPDSARNWPWDQGLTLLLRRADPNIPAVEIDFSTANLVPYVDWSLTIVDDQGDTVLIQINR